MYLLHSNITNTETYHNVQSLSTYIIQRQLDLYYVRLIIITTEGTSLDKLDQNTTPFAAAYRRPCCSTCELSNYLHLKKVGWGACFPGLNTLFQLRSVPPLDIDLTCVVAVADWLDVLASSHRSSSLSHRPAELSTCRSQLMQTLGRDHIRCQSVKCRTKSTLGKMDARSPSVLYLIFPRIKLHLGTGIQYCKGWWRARMIVKGNQKRIRVMTSQKHILLVLGT
ncbi:hypothetical protein V8F20_002568 [Naviculisporaceae sp. PSN 640]